MSGKGVQGSRHSKCKGPVACLRNRKEATVAGGTARQSMGGDEDRETIGLRMWDNHTRPRGQSGLWLCHSDMGAMGRFWARRDRLSLISRFTLVTCNKLPPAGPSLPDPCGKAAGLIKLPDK